jgi:Protein of unknown function (DUF1091)
LKFQHSDFKKYKPNDVTEKNVSKAMKVIVYTTALLLAASFVLSVDKTIKIRSLKCTSSNKSISSNFKCFAKSYSRKFSTMNFDYFMTRPLFNIMVSVNSWNKFMTHFENFTQMHLEFKHGGGITPYYNTIINATLNFCEYLNGTKSNPVIKFVLDAMEGRLPNTMIHPCPCEGSVKVYNITLAAIPVHIQFLQGRYKVSVRLYDEEDDNIITFNAGAEL